MGVAAVVASGPVDFVSASGSQVSIPLSALYFDASNALQAGNWPGYTANQAVVDPWLEYLIDTGVLRPAEQPPPSIAMIVSAKNAGSSGNNITIVFDNVTTSGTTTTFDATVTQTDVYESLTPGTLAATLGTSTSTLGSRPGLVMLSSSGTPTMPKDKTYPIPDASPNEVSVEQATSTNEAFMLKARYGAPGANLLSVVISDADQTAGTFTLTATWTKSATGIQASGLQTSFAYVITVAAPSGGSLAPPAEGRVVLSGGSETTSARAASAAVVG